MQSPKEKLISQHNLIYETAPNVWQDGFPIGNGHLGALVYQPQGIEFAISKLDIWDRRAELPPKVPFERFKKLAKESPEKARKEMHSEWYSNENTQVPAPKPCGKLSIGIDEWMINPGQTIFRQHQELSLYDAAVSGEYELSAKAMGFEAFVCSDENILVVKMEDTWGDKKLCYPYKQEISLSREIDLSLGMPATGYEDDIAWIRYKFPDGFEYVMAMSISGVELSKPEIYPDSVKIKAELNYQKKRKYAYCIYLTVVTSMDSINPMKTAKEKLHRAKKFGYKKIKRNHDNWWKKFWEKSGIEIENKLLEAVWYFSLYAFASTSRGETAPGLFGLWNADKTPPWQGDYHGDINMLMTYWPIFSSNHIELGEPFFKTFEKLLPIAKKQTKELYQIDGLKYPIATLDTGVELCKNYYRIMQCTTAFYGLIFWNWYIYTQDKKILKEHIFSILEEGAKFYLALTEKEGDSLLIGPSWAPEQGPLPAYNVNNDLGLIKPFWQAYVTACEILHVESKYKTEVQECLAHFPKYPQKDGEFVDSLTSGDFKRLSHPGHLAMVVPGEDVDAESSLAMAARKTAHNFVPKRTQRKSFSDRTSSACDLTWPWLLCVAAKLRDTQFAQHILMNIGISEFLKPNGMFAFLGGGLFRSIKDKRKAYDVKEAATYALLSLSTTRRGKDLTMSMLQQGSCYVYALNEMLMQSHGNCIRIFPAVPKCMGENCAFRELRAQGAFLVSARMRKRKTVQVVVQSMAGKSCILKIYDILDSEYIKLKTSNSKIIKAHRIAKNTWEFATEKGVKYFWPADMSKRTVELKSSGIIGIKEIKDKYGNIVSYGKKGELYE